MHNVSSQPRDSNHYNGVPPLQTHPDLRPLLDRAVSARVLDLRDRDDCEGIIKEAGLGIEKVGDGAGDDVTFNLRSNEEIISTCQSRRDCYIAFLARELGISNEELKALKSKRTQSRVIRKDRHEPEVATREDRDEHVGYFPRPLSESEVEGARSEKKRRGHAWIKSPLWELHLLEHIRRQPPVPGNGKSHKDRWDDVDHRVFQEIIRHYNLKYGAYGACFASQNQLAELTYYRRKSVGRSLDKLVRLQAIHLVHTHHGGPQCPLGERYHLPCNRDWYAPMVFCHDCCVEPKDADKIGKHGDAHQ